MKKESLKSNNAFTPIVDLGEVPTKVGTKKSLSPKFTTGFTLIELLVVIAIIGILSAVVIASLNSAREKGKIAAVKGNLKNMIAQAELTYSDNGSYSSLCTNTTGMCAGLITGMCDAITNSGGTSKCYSVDGTRWGVSSKISIDKFYSVSEQGVVSWAQTDVLSNTFTQQNAEAKCSSLGGRLPSIEQLKTIYGIYSGSNLSFQQSPSLCHWSSTTYQLDSTKAYYLCFGGGALSYANKTNDGYVHCVYPN